MRYYSAKEGVLVTRYGTRTYIGATVSVDKPGKPGSKTVIKHTDQIVALSDAEIAKHAREYLRLERDGSLIARTKSEFDAQSKAELEASKKEADAIEKAAKEREAEAKKVAAAETKASKAKDEAKTE